MRLFTRLLISHSVPVLILTLALCVVSVALLRVGFALTTLSETELTTLRDESELHRAAWSLDVAMRHGLVSCARGEQHAQIKRLVTTEAAKLSAVFKTAGRVPAPMRTVVENYLQTAREIVDNDACDALVGPAMHARRAELDEQLTNLWVDRVSELQRAVSTKEDDARRLAMTAALVGIPLAILSFLFAMWLARQLARKLEEPLAELAHSAQRVGRGDLTTPVTDVVGPPEIRALAADLERMRRELQQIEALKQGFLASVSHELRTPLSKIREGLALLQDGALGPLDDRKLRVVQIARTACEREIRMVTTLLDLSRLRSGSPLRLEDEVSIDVVVQGALDAEQADAMQRGVELKFVTQGEPVTCELDAALVERAIANVVRNAVAVSARGQRVVVERRVEPPSARAPRGSVRVRVSDDGPGVPAEIRGKLFDAFVTVPVPNSSKTVGIGIGLALAREVARAHGGDLELLESRGRGTTFELSLPLHEARLRADADVPRSLGFATQEGP